MYANGLKFLIVKFSDIYMPSGANPSLKFDAWWLLKDLVDYINNKQCILQTKVSSRKP